MTSASKLVPLTTAATLPHLTVLAQVDALILLEVSCQPVDDALVEVVAPQMGVTRGGQHLKHTVTNLQSPCTGVSRTVMLQLRHRQTAAVRRSSEQPAGRCGASYWQASFRRQRMQWRSTASACAGRLHQKHSAPQQECSDVGGPWCDAADPVHMLVPAQCTCGL